MNGQHSPWHVAVQKIWHGAQAAVYSLANADFVVQRRYLQDPIDHFVFGSGVAYAQAQAPVGGAAELGVNVAQPVVAGVAAVELELGLAGGDVQLIVRDQHFVRGNFVKARQRRHRFAREVHKGLGLQQPDGVSIDGAAARVAMEVAVHRQSDFERSGQRVDKPEPGVVARRFVALPRVTKTDKKSQGLCLHQIHMKSNTLDRIKLELLDFNCNSLTLKNHVELTSAGFPSF